MSLHRFSGHLWKPQDMWRYFSKTADSSNAHVCRVTKWQSWVCQFMVPSHACIEAWREDNMWVVEQKALSWLLCGTFSFWRDLPLQTCTWFLSRPSTGLNLTEFPIVYFWGRNMLPTATNSLWQTVACVSLGFPCGLFCHRSCPVLAPSVLAGSAGATMKSYVCHTLFNLFFPNGLYKVLFSFIWNTLGEKLRLQLLFLKISFIHQLLLIESRCY